jgi:hypothetical protein
VVAAHPPKENPMTMLETILTLTLFIVVPWCIWTAIDLWRLRRDLDEFMSRHRMHVEETSRHHAIIAALEDSRSRTADLDVPTIHRPVPEHFNEWR